MQRLVPVSSLGRVAVLSSRRRGKLAAVLCSEPEEVRDVYIMTTVSICIGLIPADTSRRAIFLD